MNIALIIGKKKSTGIKGKNVRNILGRPSVEYAFIAAKYSVVDHIFVSTDCPKIKKIGKFYNATIIDRPTNLSQPSSLTEDVLIHALKFIKKKVKKINTISLLMANNPAINVKLLNQAIKFLNKTKFYDSCFSVVKYNMFSPNRAKKVIKGRIYEFDKSLNSNKKINSIRNSQGDVYFCDLSIQVMKPSVINSIDKGQPPLKWLGKRPRAIYTDYGFDIDTEWQFKVIESWLIDKGFKKNLIPWKKK